MHTSNEHLQGIIVFLFAYGSCAVGASLLHIQSPSALETWIGRSASVVHGTTKDIPQSVRNSACFSTTTGAWLLPASKLLWLGNHFDLPPQLLDLLLSCLQLLPQNTQLRLSCGGSACLYCGHKLCLLEPKVTVQQQSAAFQFGMPSFHQRSNDCHSQLPTCTCAVHTNSLMVYLMHLQCNCCMTVKSET